MAGSTISGGYDGPERRGGDRRHQSWHMTKEFNVGHVLTSVLTIAALIYIGAKFDTRIARVEVRVSQQESENRRQDLVIAQMLEILKRDVHRIDAKLDRVIERLHRTSTAEVSQ